MSLAQALAKVITMPALMAKTEGGWPSFSAMKNLVPAKMMQRTERGATWSRTMKIGDGVTWYPTMTFEGADCETEDKMGGNKCFFKYGSKVHMKGGMENIQEDFVINQGDMVKMWYTPKFTGASRMLAKFMGPAEISCKACGEMCKMEIMGQKHEAMAPPCPIVLSKANMTEHLHMDEKFDVPDANVFAMVHGASGDFGMSLLKADGSLVWSVDVHSDMGGDRVSKDQ